MNNIEEKIEVKRGILDHLLKREKAIKTMLDEIMWERSGIELDIEQLTKKSTKNRKDTEG